MGRVTIKPEDYIIINGVSIKRCYIKFLFILNEAPPEKKTIHYITAISNMGFDIVKRNMYIWEAVGIIKVHRSKNRNFYNVDPETIERIKEALQNETEETEKPQQEQS